MGIFVPVPQRAPLTAHKIQKCASTSTGQKVVPDQIVLTPTYAGNVQVKHTIPLNVQQQECSTNQQAINHNLDMAPSPINIEMLKQLSIGYYDKEAAKNMIEGFTFGYSLQCHNAPGFKKVPQNLKSLRLNMDIARQKINKQVLEGRFSGPWKASPIPGLIISPLGLIPKKEKGTFRMIFHLSHPKKGHSINFGINKEVCSVTYASFDDALKIIQRAGIGCEIAKSDIKSSFDLLSLAPSEFRLTGFQFEGNIYFQKVLPQGCSISCKYFEEFATFIQWRVQIESGLNSISHFLDDYIMVGSRNTNNCQKLISTFNSVCARLGVPIAVNKCTSPDTRMEYLGLTIDTLKQLIIVPSDKVTATIVKLEELITKKSVTKAFLDSLVGLLTFLCKAIIPGRPFIYNMRQLAGSVQEPHYHVRVSSNVKSDGRNWLRFLRDYNGATYMLHAGWIDIGLLGLIVRDTPLEFILIHEQRAWKSNWPLEYVQVVSDNIARELLLVHLILHFHGSTMRNARVTFPCKYQETVDILQQKASKQPLYLSLLRPLLLTSMNLNIYISGYMLQGLNMPGNTHYAISFSQDLLAGVSVGSINPAIWKTLIEKDFLC